MSLIDIPGKIIEKKESFNEIQLTTALELTKLFYQLNKMPNSAQETLHTFFIFYNQIKEISPPPLDKIKSNKQFYVLILGALTILLTAIAIYYYIRR
jgi:hypothetical protein